MNDETRSPETLAGNKALLAAFLEECVTKRNIDGVETYLDEDYLDHTRMAGVPVGRQGERQALTIVLGAFSDTKMQIEDMVAEGDKVVARSTFSGTHSGPFMGVEPTGRSFAVKTIDIVRVEKGRLAEHWGFVDIPAMMTQLGLAG